MPLRRIPALAFPAVSVLAGCALAGCAFAQRGVLVADGVEVRIRPPAKWTYLGSGAGGDRGSLRAIFCAPRDFAPTEVEGAAHTPTLRILWFAKAVPAAVPASTPDGDKGWPRLTPFTDTRDYLDRVHGFAGKVTGVEPVMLGKVEARRFLAEVTSDVKLTQLVYVFPHEQGELAVEFEILTEQFAKHRGQFETCIATLEEAPADKVHKADGPETPRWQVDPKGWRALPPGTREKQRTEWGARWIAARAAEDHPGWRVQKSAEFLVLTRTDAKFTKRIVDAAVIARRWVDGRFAKISDETVMPAILRIFDSQREETAYRLREINPMEYDPGRREIHAFKDAGLGNLGDGFGGVIRGVFQQYVHDKHPLILDNLPRWLDNGLWGWMDSTRVVGKKILFFPSDVELGRFKLHADKNAPQKTWWFIHERIVETPKDGSVEPAWGYTPECVRLLRWFEEGGNTALHKDDVLVAYLAQIGATAEEVGPRPELSIDIARVPPDRMSELRKAIYARRDEFVKKVTYAAIPITDPDWQKADALFQAFNEEFAKRKFKKK